MEQPVLRRRFLRLGAVSAAALAWSHELDATEECDETEDNIEGPFYSPGAPEREALAERGMKGTPLIVSGVVMSTRCRPIPYALLDVWHCDADGVYDNKGYTLRGKIQADKNGRYQIRSIQPPPYKASETQWRPAHLHLKIGAPGMAGSGTLTTQLYFEGDKYNTVDRAYRKSLTINPRFNDKGVKTASFDFRLKVQS